MRSSRSFVEKPDWPRDEFYPARIMAWSVLTDAIKTSMMTNKPQKDGAWYGMTAVSAMIESREWLMDGTGDLPPAGYFNLRTCLASTMVGEVTLKRILRHLWLSRAEYITSTLRKMASDAVMGSQRETMAKRRNRAGKMNKLKVGPKKEYKKMERLCYRAQRIHKSSNEWAGVR